MPKFRITTSQMDPLAGAMGGPPLPPPPGGMPGMPPPPGAPGVEDASKIVLGPIKSISELIEDADVEIEIKSDPQKSPEEIALEVWQKYGGLPDGKVDKTKTGIRVYSDADRDPAMVKKEKEKQDEVGTQYERLGAGKTLADLKITLDDLTKAIKSMPFSIVQKVKSGSQPAAAGGMPPMMASGKRHMKKFSIYSKSGKFKLR